ncbi:MAG: ribosome maturation factor RimM [Chloroflexota bacterium]|nr:ribosome maturation factor RimM [Chloroflexota bacterium]
MLGAWGLRGDLKVEPLAPPAAFKPGRTVYLGGNECTIERSRRTERLLYLKLSGIEGRERAADERGRYLLVPEATLDPPAEDTYYWFQLIGLHVVSTAGEELGQISEIITTGSNDVFVVRGPRGELLIPAIDDVVQEVDIPAARMLIEPIAGLLD